MTPENRQVGKYLVELMIEQYPHANLASLVDVCAGLIVGTIADAADSIEAAQKTFDGLAAHMRVEIAHVIEQSRKAGLQ